MIALVVATILVAVAAGARLGSDRAAGLVVTGMLWTLIPFATFVLIARLQLTTGVGVGLVLGAAELTIVGVLAWAVGTRLLRLSRPAVGALIVCATLANTGYLGIPLAGALLGTDALKEAVAWDTVISGPMFYVVGFAIGAVFGAGDGRSPWRIVTRNPPLVAAVAGLLAPDALAPDVLVTAAEVVV